MFHPLLWIPITILAVILTVVIVIQCINGRYRRFVYEHSISVKKLREVNKKYTFVRIPSFDMQHSYDNENMFSDLSPRDYLIYQLVFIHRDVTTALGNTRENCEKYAQYEQEVKTVKNFGHYDSENTFKRTDKLLSYEKNLFHSVLLRPTLDLKITVTLWLTKINGERQRSKTASFTSSEISALISRVLNKKDGKYVDASIWSSITRVERAKVSNKMRFAIYSRDNYRCRKCGRKTDDLEIDHIFPISKGGKTTMDNLQTLCHRCNVEKSNYIEATAPVPKSNRASNYPRCEKCGAPMKIIAGKYGQFYGCTNYPKCKFTRNI